MKLNFARGGVERLLVHVRNATSHRASYGREPLAGLWLVGDQGVYLMSSGEPVMERDGGHVVYARECNPDRMAFDDWWATKRRSFGGDDGVEVLPLAAVTEALATYPVGRGLMLDVTPQRIGFITFVRKVAAR